MNTDNLSLKDMMEKVVPESGIYERRGGRRFTNAKLLFGTLLIAGLVLSACSAAKPTSQEATPTNNTPQVTEVVQASPTVVATETPIVATQISTEVPTQVPTKVPTEVPTQQVTATEVPWELKIGENLPKTLEEAKKINYIEWGNLENEMAELLKAEKEITVWKPNQIGRGGTRFVAYEHGIYESISALNIHHVTTLKISHDGSGEYDGRPWVKTYAYTEREIDGVVHELHLFGVESILPGNPGIVVNLHFGYEPEVAFKELSMRGMSEEFIESTFGVEGTYENFFTSGRDRYLSPDIYGGELSTNYSGENADPIAAGVIQLVEMARMKDYETLWKKAFFFEQPLTAEEIARLESIIFPCRAFTFRTEPDR